MARKELLLRIDQADYKRLLAEARRRNMPLTWLIREKLAEPKKTKHP
jgi:hypothetical protein